MKASGAALIGLGALAACDAPANGTPKPAPPDPNASLYPARRNAAFFPPLPLTPEKLPLSYNNYYEFGDSKDIADAAQALTIRPWEILVDGEVEKPFRIQADALISRMGLEERIYRHRCVETWSMVVPWTGFPFTNLLSYARPLASAKYVKLTSFMKPGEARAQNNSFFYPWPYVEALTMAEAAHDLAFLVTGIYGKPLPKQNGAPLRLAAPWKYGFKSGKGIARITFTRERPKTFWEEVGPREYGFWANVNPQVAHPRWSQAMEQPLGKNEKVPTLLYNGYAQEVAALYAGIRGEQLYR